MCSFRPSLSKLMPSTYHGVDNPNAASNNLFGFTITPYRLC